MLEPFFIKAIIAAIGVAIATSSIGVFILWKKMAYFGDAISHSAIFGLGVASIVAVEPFYGIIFCSLLFCLLMILLNRQNLYSSDTVIGITAHSLLAIGMILVVLFPANIDLESYLFGDLIILANADIALIYAVVAITLLFICLFFKKLLFAIINADLAKIAGINSQKMELQFLLLTALIVASLVKIVGIFLITSMMVMPAAIARNFANTPLQMLIIAIFVGLIVVIFGLLLAIFFNLPSSPAIILVAALMLIFSILLNIRKC